MFAKNSKYVVKVDHFKKAWIYLLPSLRPFVLLNEKKVSRIFEEMFTNVSNR